MKLEVAQKIVAAALASATDAATSSRWRWPCSTRAARSRRCAAEDGTSLKRAEIAIGKAHGALAMGLGSRTLGKLAAERPHFMAAVTHAVGGSLIPVPGGVLIRDGAGALIGAVGISGDTSDNDETAAVAGIEAAGCKADPRSLSTRHAGAARGRDGARGPRARAARAPLRARGAAPQGPALSAARALRRAADGRARCERLDRRAKYILVHLDERRGAGRAPRHDRPLQRAAADALPSPSWGGRGSGTRIAYRPQECQLGEYTHEHGDDAKHDHLVFTMSGGAVVTYNDARRFGYMTLIPESELDAARVLRAASASSRSATT